MGLGCVKMFRLSLRVTFVFICGFGLVFGECPKCQLTNEMSWQDKLQAVAYNGMPKECKSVLIPKDAKAFVQNTPNGFGPEECLSECKPHWLYTGIGVCSTRKPTPFIQYRPPYIGFCAPKYSDKRGNLCQHVPKFGEYWRMWCGTTRGRGWGSWGYTHFPMCSTTNTMCVPIIPWEENNFDTW